MFVVYRGCSYNDSVNPVMSIFVSLGKPFTIYNKFSHVLKTNNIWFPRSFSEHNMLSIFNFKVSFKPPFCIKVVVFSHKLYDFTVKFRQ